MNSPSSRWFSNQCSFFYMGYCLGCRVHLRVAPIPGCFHPLLCGQSYLLTFLFIGCFLSGSCFPKLLTDPACVSNNNNNPLPQSLCVSWGLALLPDRISMCGQYRASQYHCFPSPPNQSFCPYHHAGTPLVCSSSVGTVLL